MRSTTYLPRRARVLLDPFAKFEKRSFIHFRNIKGVCICRYRTPERYRAPDRYRTDTDIKTLPATPTSWRRGR